MASIQHGMDDSLPLLRMFYMLCSVLLLGQGCGLISFICYNGYGGLPGKLLSLKIWIPLSKLSFIAYLINPIILIVFFASLRQTLYITNTTVIAYGLATVVLSFGVAAVIASVIEFPSPI